jgi:FkbM family methyltransferase
MDQIDIEAARQICVDAFIMRNGEDLGKRIVPFWELKDRPDHSVVILTDEAQPQSPYLPEFTNMLQLNGAPFETAPFASYAAGGANGGKIYVSGLADAHTDPGAEVMSIATACFRLQLDSCGHGSIWTGAVADTRSWFKKLLDCEHRLSDDLSKMTLYYYLADLLNGLGHYLPEVRLTYDQQYWGTGLFEPTADEIVADVGAFDGDTLEKYVSHFGPSFRRWFSFEPDPSNLATLLSKVASNSAIAGKEVYPEMRLAWSKTESLRFVKSGHTIGHIGDDDGAPNHLAISLDDYFAGMDDPTIIKTDVEGADFGVLKGAAKIIERSKPKLFLSCYHHCADLVRMIDFASATRSDYRFYLRNHSWANKFYGDPGAQFCETVLYAL